MAFPGSYTTIAEKFVEHYYNYFDCVEFRCHLRGVYHAQAMLIFEGESIQGQDNIMKKITSLPFKTIKHVVTKLDALPTTTGGILILITGQLQADDDKPLSFSQVFNLHYEGESYSIINEFFRLSIHNIPVT
ncbi:nuclear transport factor 2 [Octopus sinensis]|uniref:NTF2-related export protein n=1 Tax=Octopus sinensis TaxID=2607531 RepID=A0A6P7SFC2_9MOLL|nr:nuclear transport factor 2 [Octopus sinensis]